MPTSVRAAQVTVFVMMGLCLLMSVVVGVGSGSRAAGATFGQNLMGCVLFVLAFRYRTAGNGVRVASIVLASVQIVLALGGTARGIQGGIFALAGAVTVVVLLSQGTAGAWFKRARVPGLPYGAGPAVR
ncbi:hypothetical protein [Streptomyces lutosisoli]|uniref:Integral membrane protein n=1 Tax=Streptomyces lutosisoli TaxID=2665721 RepID=A0ABW2VHX0_9ACTN